MAPGKRLKAARPEFEVADYTEELGRSLRGKMLQKRVDDFSDSSSSAARHDEFSAESFESPPREDRAG